MTQDGYFCTFNYFSNANISAKFTKFSTFCVIKRNMDDNYLS